MINKRIKRPALRYYGGKWNLAPWIISHLPPHHSFIDLCGGGASVLLRKERSNLETYNDLDGNVVNFFRVLRDEPDALIQKIKLTPWAREEHELSRQSCEDKVESARRFFVSLWMSMRGGHHSKESKTWRVTRDARGRGVYDSMSRQERNLYNIAERFFDVQIENDDAMNVFRRFDKDGAVFYFDPPYIKDTRSSPDTYLIEQSDQFHIDASGSFQEAKGFVLVSGYNCALYNELYDQNGWYRVDKDSQVNGGGVRTESLWLSPRTWDALHGDYSDLPLFG